MILYQLPDPESELEAGKTQGFVAVQYLPQRNQI
jgi:hypothetical protein